MDLPEDAKLFDWVMPDGKRLAECTEEDCLQLAFFFRRLAQAMSERAPKESGQSVPTRIHGDTKGKILQ
jgi:hypothetical protein